MSFSAILLYLLCNFDNFFVDIHHKSRYLGDSTGVFFAEIASVHRDNNLSFFSMTVNFHVLFEVTSFTSSSSSCSSLFILFNVSLLLEAPITGVRNANLSKCGTLPRIKFISHGSLMSAKSPALVKASTEKKPSKDFHTTSLLSTLSSSCKKPTEDEALLSLFNLLFLSRDNLKVEPSLPEKKQKQCYEAPLEVMR